MKHKKGHWVWILAKGKLSSYCEDGSPQWVYGTHEDITERKNDEILINRLQELYEKTKQAAKIGTWEVDMEKNVVFWDENTKNIHEVNLDFIPNLEEGINFYKAGNIEIKFLNILKEA